MSTFGSNMTAAIKRRMDKQAAEQSGDKAKAPSDADKTSFVEKAKAKLGFGK
jgi:DnaJ-domain-containing protein 1